MVINRKYINFIQQNVVIHVIEIENIDIASVPTWNGGEQAAIPVDFSIR